MNHDVTTGDMIDSGAHGRVLECSVDGTKGFAVKRVKKSHLSETIAELAILCSLRHPNLLASEFTPAITADSIDMLLPRADCNLRSLSAATGGCLSNEQRTRDWTIQLCQGLQALHSHDIIHSDIKTSNVLLFGDNLKLCDFSLSIQKRLKTSTFKHMTATITHRALEVFLVNEGYSWDEGQDVWALGCVIFEMVYGERLFPYQESESPDGNDSMCTTRSIRALLHWGTTSTNPQTPIIHSARSLVGHSEPAYKSPFVHNAYNSPSFINSILHRFLCLDPADRGTIAEALQSFQVCQEVPTLFVSQCKNIAERDDFPCRELYSKVVDLKSLTDDAKLRACELINFIVSGVEVSPRGYEEVNSVETVLVYLGFRVLSSKKR